jgi:large subunit ribosomal protein L1
LPKRHGKKYQEALKKVEEALGQNGDAGLEPKKAVEVARDTSTAKFDATVEAHVRLGIDVRHADQQLRSAVTLPRGTGKNVRVAVFAAGEKEREAREAGADIVGGDDLVKRVSEGFTDFDVAIATPDMMSKVGPLGRILGPRGLMPSPRSGTVTTDIASGVREFKAGKIEFRNDKGGNVAAPVGKLSFTDTQLIENINTFLNHLRTVKPAAAKGTYIRSVTISATMSPGIKIQA